MNIPMPGHSIPNAMRKEVEESITQLEKLIDESDVIFLLMDTRESRWLPTVVAAAKEKVLLSPVMNLIMSFSIQLIADLTDFDCLS